MNSTVQPDRMCSGVESTDTEAQVGGTVDGKELCAFEYMERRAETL